MKYNIFKKLKASEVLPQPCGTPGGTVLHSAALSQIPAYTVKPCIGHYQIILLGDTGTST